MLFLLMIILDSLGFILWNLNLISLIFFFNFKNLWKTNIPLVLRFFKAMEVPNLLVLASKLTYVLLASIINSLVHIHLLKMVILRENIVIWLRLAWPFRWGTTNTSNKWIFGTWERVLVWVMGREAPFPIVLSSQAQPLSSLWLFCTTLYNLKFLYISKWFSEVCYI